MKPEDFTQLRSHGSKVLQEVGMFIKLSADHKDEELIGRIEKVQCKTFLPLVVIASYRAITVLCDVLGIFC